LKNFLAGGGAGAGTTAAAETVTKDSPELGRSDESEFSWVRDLKNFLALGTPGGTGGCSPVLMLVKLVAPHLPTIPALFAATGLLHCSFIILSNGFPFAPPPPFLEYVFLL